MSRWREVLADLRGLVAVKLVGYAFHLCDANDPLKHALARFVLENRAALDGTRDT